MLKMDLKILVVFCLVWVEGSRGHSYHLGDCPNVQPLTNFEMNKFLGKWYVVEKTKTRSKCLTYNLSRSRDVGEYLVEQVSAHPVLGLASPDNRYHYTGTIKAPYKDQPSKMSVNFPLNPLGSASYVVFATDYDNYGAIFTCQELAVANRRSISVLSRKPSLDNSIIDEIHTKISNYGINPHDLSTIDHEGCAVSVGTHNVVLNGESATEKNFETILKENGEAINYIPEDVEFVTGIDPRIRSNPRANLN